ncbi:MAG: hypothetical protein N3B15_04465 [Planctomycetota bacterium]|nr:hypothetical protein [Planctomycetota bacterium]
MRAFIASLLLSALVAGETAPPPMPGLPPEPRVLQLTSPLAADAQRAQVMPRFSDEIQALRRALERARSELGIAAAPAPTAAPPTPTESPAELGPPLASPRYGERLRVTKTPVGGALVDADLGPVSADEAVRELAALLGMTLDEERPAQLSRAVHLRVAALPYHEALDRLLGQLGLTWREEGGGSTRRLIIDRGMPSASERERRARRAFERLQDGPRGPLAAEALWLLAQQEAGQRRPAEALRLYMSLIDTYGASPDTAVQPWVQRAARGAGEALLSLGSPVEARIALRSWLVRAEPKDPEAARVLLLSAQAARQIGDRRQDVAAYDDAVDDLHRLLQDHAEDPRVAAEVAAARLLIAELLYTAATRALQVIGSEEGSMPADVAARLREVEAQLQRWLAATGRSAADAPDLQAFWLAECAFHLGRAEEARARYELLHRRWRDGKTDPKAPANIYAESAFRIGECWLRQREPSPVRALFAFLRARQDFPTSEIAPQVLIRIAYCYAELEAEEHAVQTLQDLLRDERIADAAPLRQQLDRLLGELVGRLGRYPGPVRARVLFYIARAQWLQAQRDRREQAQLAQQAAATYRRVLDEQPSPELRHAAQLGMARSLLLAGDDDRGEAELRRLLRDPTLGDRDRAYAGQLLGEHLRARGRLREAIRAFRGEISE